MTTPETSNLSERKRVLDEQFYRLKDELNSRVMPDFRAYDTITFSRIIGDMVPNVGHCSDEVAEANARFLDHGRSRRLEKIAEYFRFLDRDSVALIEPLFVIAAQLKVASSIEEMTREIERLRKMADLPA